MALVEATTGLIAAIISPTAFIERLVINLIDLATTTILTLWKAAGAGSFSIRWLLAAALFAAVVGSHSSHLDYANGESPRNCLPRRIRERVYDAGRGRLLPPIASSTGLRYYTLKDRAHGLLGVYCGWSRFRHAWTGGQQPPQRSFIGTESLEEGLAYLGRHHAEKNSLTIHL